MAYSVLVVDDEPSSIRYIKNLIAAYLPDYRVVGEAFSGQAALELIKNQPIDLLITDARMPGMDGIELAREARCLHGEQKIVVVSGYADFEYAKGALSAGVNEYLLKPLNIERTVAVLGEVKDKLDLEYMEARRAALGRLALGQKVEPQVFDRYVGVETCHVGLLRRGNLPAVRAIPTGAPPPRAEGFMVLPGRDDMEWIALSLHEGDLARRLRALADGLGEATTLVWWAQPQPLSGLRDAVYALTRALDERLVMGKSQALALPLASPPPAGALPMGELRKLDHYILSGDMEHLKELLFGWAVAWERQQLPQRGVEGLIHQIVERAMASLPQAQARRATARQEIDELFQVASNAGELMSGLWDVLLAPLQAAKARRPQADELIGEICAYLREHCAEPITMQVACAHFGVSQTHLSRLFRKHEGTTFNDFLTDCRMDLAKRLMRQQPDMKLRDVAALCGYEDPSYFSKVFRQRQGVTPQQYAFKAID